MVVKLHGYSNRLSLRTGAAGLKLFGLHLIVIMKVVKDSPRYYQPLLALEKTIFLLFLTLPGTRSFLRMDFAAHMVEEISLFL